MQNYFKIWLCKNHDWIWLTTMRDEEGTIIYPVRVCRKCQKLTWAYRSGLQYTFVKPIISHKGVNDG